MPHLLLSLLLLLCSYFPVFAQGYNWVRGGGTTQTFTTSLNQETVSYMCTDPNGNVYALSKVGINPVTADTFYWPGGIGSSQSILFTSHNCNGQMRFAKLITGTGNFPNGVVADSMGHVYIGFDGTHSGTNPLRIRHDTTISSYTFNRDVLVQYDTSGNLNWLRFVGADAYSTWSGTGGWSNFLVLDGSQKPHFVIYANYGVTLTPSLTTDRKGFYDNTYDVSGNLLSVNRLELDSTLAVEGLDIDKRSNKLYAYGSRSPSFWTMPQFIFLGAFDTIRNNIWLDSIINPLYPGGCALRGVKSDGWGNIYLSINSARAFVYRGDTVWNDLVTSGASSVGVILKADTSGNKKWVRKYNSNSGGSGFLGLTLLPNNKIAAGGSFVNRLACGNDTMTVYAGEGQNAFFTIMDSAGYVQEFEQLHGIGFYDNINVCASDRKGNLYLGGKIENNIWGGSIAPYTSVGGDSDYFIMKYGVDCNCTYIPNANYTYTGSELSRSFTYTGTTTGIDSIRWFFGDGGTASGFTAVHTYTSSGTYTTCVKVYTGCGNDMRCKEITVACTTPPAAAYADTGNYVRGFVYTGTTSVYYDSVKWYFDDGFTDTGLAVTHTYAVADTYNVCAIIYTRCGKDTFCKSIIINNTTTTVHTLAAPDYTISVYPNPARQQLVISANAPIRLVIISNTMGQLLLQYRPNAATHIADVSKLPPGVYIVRVNDVWVRRFVKE